MTLHQPSLVWESCHFFFEELWKSTWNLKIKKPEKADVIEDIDDSLYIEDIIFYT